MERDVNRRNIKDIKARLLNREQAGRYLSIGGVTGAVIFLVNSFLLDQGTGKSIAMGVAGLIGGGVGGYIYGVFFSRSAKNV